MSATSRSAASILAGILVAAAASAPPTHLLCAQEKSATQSSPANTPSKPTIEEAARRLEELKKNTSLKADVRKRIESYFTQAGKALNFAAGFDRRLQDLESLKRNANRQTNEAQQELAKPIADPDDGDAFHDLKELEDRLKLAQAEKKGAEKEAGAWETKQAARLKRKTVVPQRLVEAKRELAKAVADSQGKPPSTAPAEAVPALRFLQQSQIVGLQSEVAVLEAELPIYKSTDELVDLTIRAERHRSQRADRLVIFWGRAVEKHRGFEARRQVVESQTMIDNFKKAQMHQVLVDLATENLRLASLRTGPDGTVAKLHNAQTEMSEVESLLKRIDAEHKDLAKKLEIEGIEGEIGPLLVVKRRELPNVGRYSRRIVHRNRMLSHLRLSFIDTQQQANRLLKFDTAVDAVARQAAGSRDQAARRRATAAAGNILQQRKAIFDMLLSDYRTLLEQLAQLTARERQLIETAESFRQLIDRHILWVRTTTPFGIAEVKDLRQSLRSVFDIEQWQKTTVILTHALRARPVLSAAMLLLLAFAIYKTPTMKRRLNNIGKDSGRNLLQPFSLTVHAFVFTGLLSAIGPAAIWFIGWSLQSYSETTAFAEMIGTALQVVAASLLTFDFLRRMFRPRGLAESHFRWKDARLKILRRNLRWFMLAALPGIFVYVLVREFGDDTSVASLGRLTLVILLLLVAGFLAVVLRDPKVKLPFSEVFGVGHSAAAQKASLGQVVVFLGVVLFPVVLAGLALAGYLYTAELLTWKLLCSAWLAVCLLTLHAMGVRWLYYARGKLALERSQAAKAAAEAVAANSEQAAAAQTTARPTVPETADRKSPASKPPAPDGAAKLATINTQTRKLLRIAVGCAAFVGLWSIWQDVVPALKFLDSPLWSYQVETIRQAAEGDTAAIPETMTVLKAFTLFDLLLAVAIVAIVFVAASNLPGLLEVGLLQKLPLDSGARYAATALTRYGIYAVGVVVAFNLMGIGWAKVQWLIAALSVGLGFGLQEIVANFVSGIILLFERPLRVGDIVTIGDVSGVVTRIKIRATTVRNWDRKEYIVPNKELITGKLMNWTLSDSVNRIVINVGVGYGSNPEEVRRILMDVVGDHPDILKDPGPMVTMEGFGDSALDFVIRCYLSELGPRMETTHDLHAEIHRRLGAAGIEIPFPQRDLHIRRDTPSDNGAGQTEATSASATRQKSRTL